MAKSAVYHDYAEYTCCCEDRHVRVVVSFLTVFAFATRDKGDLGRFNPITGDLIVTGRAKDTIVLSNGENVEPQPLEVRGLAAIRRFVRRGRPILPFCKRFLAATSEYSSLTITPCRSDASSRVAFGNAKNTTTKIRAHAPVGCTAWDPFLAHCGYNFLWAVKCVRGRA